MEDNSFRLLYEKCSKYCLKGMARYTNNIQEAEDVFAEAISIYWLKQKQGRMDNHQNIPAYVFTIAKNLYLSKKRKMVITEDIEIFKNKKGISIDEINLFQEESEMESLLRRSFGKLGEA